MRDMQRSVGFDIFEFTLLSRQKFHRPMTIKALQIRTNRSPRDDIRT